jgi:hypothetical protein
MKAAILVLLSLTPALSGCLQAGSIDCPDTEGNDLIEKEGMALIEKWGAFINQTDEGFDGVGVRVQRLRPPSGDEKIPAVEWALMPPELRPEIVNDLLCHTHARFPEDLVHDAGPAMGVPTSRAIAEAAMAAIAAAHQLEFGAACGFTTTYMESGFP